jgi:hypothetical protein
LDHFIARGERGATDCRIRDATGTNRQPHGVWVFMDRHEYDRDRIMPPNSPMTSKVMPYRSAIMPERIVQRCS